MTYAHVRDGRKRKRSFHRAFLTKAQAARKLSLPHKEFKRLCILKGVYPRHVKKIPDAAKKTGIKASSQFYFNKDINWIAEDPIVKKLFKFRTYQKRIRKFAGRGDIHKGKHYRRYHKPQYSIVHCVKERYSTFVEAIREVDDALCHVFLYSQLPPQMASDSTIEGHSHLTTALSKKSKDLIGRWNEFIVKAKCLRKAFISIKGYYFQAEIQGQLVTWLVPHHFTTKTPGEVDYHVMMSFLEFYLVMLDFVLFRLEHDLQVSIITKPQEEDDDETEKVKDDTVEDFPISPEEQAARQQLEQCANLFKGFKFYISHEVPQQNFSLITRACGGTITTNEAETDITHQIIDRPTVKNMVPNRDYVQPQWLVDCLNCRHLLPVDQYMPGKDLPPHLSPFEEALVVDHDGKAYEPDRLKELKRIMDPTYHAIAARLEGEGSDEEQDDDLEVSESEPESLPEAEMPTDGIVTSDDETGDEDEEMDKAEQLRLKRSAQAQKPATPKEKAKAEPVDKTKALEIAYERKKKMEDTEKRMRSFMLSNKKRKLWQRIKTSQKRLDERVSGLAEKSKMIAQGKLKVANAGYLVDPAAQRNKNKRRKERRENRGTK